MTLWEFDETYQKPVIGIDEAGRGPLAGVVVAAAVMIKNYVPEFDEINDSKKLSEKKREKLFPLILKNCSVGIGIASVEEIDQVNILQATFLAMSRAALKLSATENSLKEHTILIDGNKIVPQLKGFRQEAIVKGDSKSLAIAAASIIAKVTRDTMMKYEAKRFPEYEFLRHKGYGTKLHRERILQFGPCDIHRKSFLTKILVSDYA